MIGGALYRPRPREACGTSHEADDSLTVWGEFLSETDLNGRPKAFVSLI
jgi:hypothetical protein